MATGAAAQQAAQKQPAKQQAQDTDKGEGSVAGNLVADPEMRYTANGRPVTNLRIASSERVLDEKSGQWKDGPTVFFDVQCWGNLAENICNDLQKGDRIVAEGRWQETHFESKDSEVVTRVYLRARDLGPSMMFRGARVERKQGGK